MSIKWERVRVDEVCESIIDCVNKTAPIVEGPTPYKMIRTTNVRNGWVDVLNVRYVDEDTYAKWTRRQVPEVGDVILTREAPLGEVGMLRSTDNVFLGQRLVAYRADRSKIDPSFLLYAFLEDDVQNQIRSFGSGSTVEHMRVPDAKLIELNLPPLPVQWRIAEILSAYDELIAVNERRIAILEEMARRLFEQSCPMSDELEQRTLGDILELAYGKGLTKKARKPGSVPVYGSGGVVGEHDEALVDEPGIIVGRKGSIGSIFWSRVAFFPIDTVFFVKTDLPLPYVYNLLRKLTFLNSDAAVPGLNRTAALGMKIPAHSDETIHAFAERVDPMYGCSDKLETANARLREARDLLLPRLVSGELDVSEAPAPLTMAAE